MSVAPGLVPLPVQVHLDLDVPRGVGAFLPGTLLAVVAAVLFAVGSVLQHEAAETTHADDGGFRVRAMVRRPKWLLGQRAP